MGGCISNDSPAAAPLTSAQLARLSATQRACLDSWQRVLAGDTAYCRQQGAAIVMTAAGLARTSSGLSPGAVPATSPTGPRGSVSGASSSSITLLFDVFYAHLSATAPDTAVFFSHGGIPRKARALVRMVGSLLDVKGAAVCERSVDGEAASAGAVAPPAHAAGASTACAAPASSAEARADSAALSAVAERHALMHGVGAAHYEACLATLQHSLRVLLGDEWTIDVAAAWKATCTHALSYLLPAARAASRPLVVILGGGFAGWSLARLLDASGLFRLLLIERKEFLLFNIGGLRASVQPDFTTDVLLPLHTTPLQHGTLLPADVLELRRDGVRVHGREQLVRFDIAVVATGSAYAFPGKISSTRRDDILARYHECAEAIRLAKHIVIAGGGAVGVELAGEIGCAYRVAPGSAPKVTLVQRHTHLLRSLPAEVGESAQRLLEKLGVQVLCGEAVELSEADRHTHERDVTLLLRPSAENRDVKTSSGRALQADIMFVCSGTNVNSGSYQQNFGSVLNRYKQLLVNTRFQVQDPDSAPSSILSPPMLDHAPDASLAPAPQAVTLPLPAEKYQSAGSDAPTVPSNEASDAAPVVAAVAPVPAASPVGAPSPRYLSNLFAIGDCCSLDPNQSKRAGMHADWLAAYLIWCEKRAKAEAAGAPASPLLPVTLADFVPDARVTHCLISIGRQACVAYTAAGAQAWEEGAAPASPASDPLGMLPSLSVKARTLFMPFYWNKMGVPYAQRRQVDWESARDTQTAEDVQALSVSMQVTPAQARIMLRSGATVMQRAASTTYT